MVKRHIFLLVLIAMQMSFLAFSNPQAPVLIKTLENGFTILVKETNNTQKVSFRLYYKVGSKDEVDGQRGIAHLLEHMIFLGTYKLSATDIDLICRKFGANNNAHTTTDHTYMEFDVPIKHWHILIPILADCMNNCTLKQEHLNSEFKVVLAEFKKARDNYEAELGRKMTKSLFPLHPYSHPVIGYKNDICTINSPELKAFYTKFYVPNNAVLIVVGNVNSDEVFAACEREFGILEAKPVTTQSHPTIAPGSPHTIELHRDIMQPYVQIDFKIPPFLKDPRVKLLTLIDSILFNQESGRIVKKLRDEFQVVNSIYSYHDDLLDNSVYSVAFYPKNHEKSTFQSIINSIQEELDRLADDGYTTEEMKMACELFEQGRNDCLAYNRCQAEMIAKGYFHVNDPNFAYTFTFKPEEDYKKDMQTFIKTFFQKTNSCIGYLLPASEEEKKAWRSQQEAEDLLDAKILAERPHEKTREEGKYVHMLTLTKDSATNFPEPNTYILSNGLQVLYYRNDDVPTIECGLDFKITGEHKIESSRGTLNMMSLMMKEGGTKTHSGKELKKILAHNAFSLDIGPGLIRSSVPSKSLPQFLDLLYELLATARFEEQELSKIKEWGKTNYKSIFESGSKLANLLHRGLLMNDKALKNLSETAITSVKRQSLIDAYQTYISPSGAVLAIVGDLSAYPELPTLLEKALGKWSKNELKDYARYQAQDTPDSHTMYHYLDRDQAFLSMAKTSVSPKEPAAIALALYGILLHEALLRLREKTGIFYSASAQFNEPFVQIMTRVSPENLDVVRHRIFQTLDSSIETCTEEELSEAKNSVLESVQSQYGSNIGILEYFLYLHKHALPFNQSYLLDGIENLTLSTFKEQVKKVIDPASFNTVLVGRVCKPNTCDHLINREQCGLLFYNTTKGSFDRHKRV